MWLQDQGRRSPAIEPGSGELKLRQNKPALIKLIWYRSNDFLDISFGDLNSIRSCLSERQVTNDYL